MSTNDFPSASPGDAVIAVRSFPRRYRQSLLPADEPVFEAQALQLGPDGVSAVEIAADTLRTWLIQREALRQTQRSDFPLFHPAVVDPVARQWQTPMHETCARVLDQLDELADDLAAEMDSISGDQWNRSGTIAGGDSVTALQLVQHILTVASENLRRIDRTLAAVRN